MTVILDALVRIVLNGVHRRTIVMKVRFTWCQIIFGYMAIQVTAPLCANADTPIVTIDFEYFPQLSIIQYNFFYNFIINYNSY